MPEMENTCNYDIEESSIPFSLRKKIIEFLTTIPSLHDSEALRAFLYSAGLDIQLQNQINFAVPPIQFFQILVSILSNYGMLRDGRDALTAILKSAQNYVGQQGKDYCDTLIQELSLHREDLCSSETVNTLIENVPSRRESSRRIAKVIGKIPHIRTKVYLGMTGFIVIILIIINSDSIKILPSALAIAAIPVVIIATFLSSWFPHTSDIVKILSLFIIMLFSFLLIILAFYFDQSKSSGAPGMSWDGRFPIETLIGDLEHWEHINFTYDAENMSHSLAKETINSLVLCPQGEKFKGKNEYNLFEEIIWNYRKCLSVELHPQKKLIHLRLLNKTGMFVKDGTCDICKELIEE